MTTLKQFKDTLNNRLINISKNLNKWEKMGIASKLKIDTLTVTKYTSGKIEQIRNLALAEKIIEEGEKIMKLKVNNQKDDIQE
jgi:hypothetical protein